MSNKVYTYEFWDVFTVAEYRDILAMSQLKPETQTNGEQLISAGVDRFIRGADSKGVVNSQDASRALNFFQDRGIISAQRKTEIIQELLNR